MEFREVKLPSGATLKVAPAPFAASKALYQALLKEMKGISVSGKGELGDLIKNVFCAGFSSPEIEACLWKCMAHSLYDNGKDQRKVDADTFEPVEARQDWTVVCIEVAEENVTPFGKSLMQLYFQYLASAESTQASRPPMSPSLPISNSPLQDTAPSTK